MSEARTRLIRVRSRGEARAEAEEEEVEAHPTEEGAEGAPEGAKLGERAEGEYHEIGQGQHRSIQARLVETRWLFGQPQASY